MSFSDVYQRSRNSSMSSSHSSISNMGQSIGDEYERSKKLRISVEQSEDEFSGTGSIMDCISR
jgi:hypothetical protein